MQRKRQEYEHHRLRWDFGLHPGDRRDRVGTPWVSHLRATGTDLLGRHVAAAGSGVWGQPWGRVSWSVSCFLENGEVVTEISHEGLMSIKVGLEMRKPSTRYPNNVIFVSFWGLGVCTSQQRFKIPWQNRLELKVNKDYVMWTLFCSMISVNMYNAIILKCLLKGKHPWHVTGLVTWPWISLGIHSWTLEGPSQKICKKSIHPLGVEFHLALFSHSDLDLWNHHPRFFGPESGDLTRWDEWNVCQQMCKLVQFTADWSLATYLLTVKRDGTEIPKGGLEKTSV